MCGHAQLHFSLSRHLTLYLLSAGESTIIRNDTIKKKGSKICSKSWTTAQHHIISPSNVTLMMTLEAPRTNFLKHQFILANKGDWFCHISVVFCAPLLCRHRRPPSTFPLPPAWVKNMWCHVSLSAIWVSRMRSKCTHTGLTRQIRWVYECKTHKIVTRYVSVWEKKFLWFLPCCVPSAENRRSSPPPRLSGFFQSKWIS